jgi:predicted DNA-binding protein
MMSKKRHQPPSRIKYAQSHPTVSIRVSRELYDSLKELRLKSGKSLGDILREALGKQAPTVKQAFDRGYKMASEKFRVIYHCSTCDKPIEVTTPDEKKAIADYMKEHRWSHSQCLKK